MTRKECLDKAAECVLRDRQKQYGEPEDCFGMIARMWGAYLGVCISAHDVAAMMALLKIARFRHNPSHEDNAVDCAGYAACMIETATAWEREGEAKAEGVEESAYNPDNDVVGEVVTLAWPRGKVLEKRYASGRDEKCAEGCEDLVFDEAKMRESMPGIVPQDGPSGFDAPQTKEELYDRIVANNPATFGCAHKPTGEELAEMAEEEAHG